MMIKAEDANAVLYDVVPLQGKHGPEERVWGDKEMPDNSRK